MPRVDNSLFPNYAIIAVGQILCNLLIFTISEFLYKSPGCTLYVAVNYYASHFLVCVFWLVTPQRITESICYANSTLQ